MLEATLGVRTRSLPGCQTKPPTSARNQAALIQINESGDSGGIAVAKTRLASEAVTGFEPGAL
jgi:hypothetical protein